MKRLRKKERRKKEKKKEGVKKKRKTKKGKKVELDLLYLKSHQEKYIAYIFVYPVYFLKCRGKFPKLKKQEHPGIRLNKIKICKICSDLNNGKKLSGIHRGLRAHIRFVLIYVYCRISDSTLH